MALLMDPLAFKAQARFPRSSSVCGCISERRGMAIAEVLLVAFGDKDVANGAVWKRAVVEEVGWWHWLRAVKRLVISGRAVGRCILMSRLSTFLKGVTNNEISGRIIAFADAAAVTPPRPDLCHGQHRRHGRDGEAAQRSLG